MQQPRKKHFDKEYFKKKKKAEESPLSLNAVFIFYTSLFDYYFYYICVIEDGNYFNFKGSIYDIIYHFRSEKKCFLFFFYKKEEKITRLE